MQKNLYDTDVTTWSPTGRLYQVEYATAAVTQGSASIGLVGDDFAVIVGLKRSPSELASYQHKIFRIDDHIGIAISGLTADGRTLSKSLRADCLNHKFIFGTPIVTSRLVSDLADKHQECTQVYVRRPYGVGLLVASYDSDGPHLYQTEPSGEFFEYKAHAIGSRSQAGRTYLESHVSEFSGLGRDALVQHALRALRGCTDSEQTLTVDNTTIGVVGKDQPFQRIDGDDVAPFLAALAEDDGAAAAAGGGEGGAAESAAAD